jgi:hypothetical protein
MKIQIEDYFGNDVLTLEYNQLTSNTELVDKVETNSLDFGYGVADVDLDENNNEFIRLQNNCVDLSEEQEKQDLVNLISKLNNVFL